jgi:hypothetical protein
VRDANTTLVLMSLIMFYLYGDFMQERIVNAIDTIQLATGETFRDAVEAFLSPIATVLLEQESACERFSHLLQRFDDRDLVQIIHASLPMLLPTFIANQDAEALNHIAQLANDDPEALCINYAHDILTHLLLLDDHERKMAGVQYLIGIVSSETQMVTMADLVSSCSLQLVVNLVLQLGTEDLSKIDRVPYTTWILMWCSAKKRFSL